MAADTQPVNWGEYEGDPFETPFTAMVWYGHLYDNAMRNYLSLINKRKNVSASWELVAFYAKMWSISQDIWADFVKDNFTKHGMIFSGTWNPEWDIESTGSRGNSAAAGNFSIGPVNS